MINVAILGFGTVGSGVYEVIKTNKELINKQIDDEINVKYILDLKDFKGTEVESLMTSDYNDILEDDDIHVVIEVLGGLEPAYTFVKKALLKGKSVATSNKELVAKYGPELVEIANVNDVSFLFEASVGGGIPIIRPINESLVADKVTEIKGILNGTTNYILTKMEKEGLAFETVLKEAQELGYAERHPEADVEGHDACRKIAILSSLVQGKFVDYEDVYTEGITKITTRDIDYAKKIGHTIKLLATYSNIDEQIYAYVAPMMIDSDHQLSHVHDVFNAVYVHGNVLDDAMFYGRGAGKLPTASAVCSDVVNAIKSEGKHIKVNLTNDKQEIAPFGHIPMAYFVRTAGKVTEENQAVIKEIFGDVEYIEPISDEELVFFTGEETEEALTEKFVELEGKGLEIASKIRLDV